MNTLLQQSHQRIRLRRVSDEEVSIAQHVSHDTAVDDRLSWRAADPGAALERPATQKRYSNLINMIIYTQTRAPRERKLHQGRCIAALW